MIERIPEALRGLAGELGRALRGELEGAGAALEAGDGAALAARLHALKGAAMRFGLTEVWESAARAEQAGGAALRGELEALGALLDVLEREAREAADSDAAR